MDIDSILQQLMSLDFGDNESVSLVTTEKSQDLDKILPPIRVSHVNVGIYSPGVATDKRHTKGHYGVDLAAPEGTPIYSIASGKVSRVGSNEISGNFVSIKHEDGLTSFYAHLNSINVKQNQDVTNQTVIGTVGDTGNAKGTSPHLHIETKQNGGYVNPGSLFSVPQYKPLKTKKAHIEALYEDIKLFQKLSKF